jgi:hypothetical protein
MASDYCADQDLRNENHHAADPLVADLARLETATRPTRPACHVGQREPPGQVRLLDRWGHDRTQTCRVGR